MSHTVDRPLWRRRILQRRDLRPSSGSLEVYCVLQIDPSIVLDMITTTRIPGRIIRQRTGIKGARPLGFRCADHESVPVHNPCICDDGHAILFCDSLYQRGSRNNQSFHRVNSLSRPIAPAIRTNLYSTSGKKRIESTNFIGHGPCSTFLKCYIFSIIFRPLFSDMIDKRTCRS